MSKSLAKKRRPKGWTPERRARQAALIRTWQPWLGSTGPKTEAGKARSSRNAYRHGCRSRDFLHAVAETRRAIGRVEATIVRIRMHFALDMRSKSGRRKIVLLPPRPLRLSLGQERAHPLLEVGAAVARTDQVRSIGQVRHG